MTRTALTPRPTLYRGIRMRSRLEATYAQICDNRGDIWAYEPNCFADDRGQYLPDFRLGTTAPYTYVEVKPYLTHDIALDIVRRMAIIRSSEPDSDARIWTPDGECAPHKGDWYYQDTILVPSWEWEVDWYRDDLTGTVDRTSITWVPGLHPVPDDHGNYYQADDPRRPF